jgi:hypothetical protein
MSSLPHLAIDYDLIQECNRQSPGSVDVGQLHSFLLEWSREGFPVSVVSMTQTTEELCEALTGFGTLADSVRYIQPNPYAYLALVSGANNELQTTTSIDAIDARTVAELFGEAFSRIPEAKPYVLLDAKDWTNIADAMSKSGRGLDAIIVASRRPNNLGDEIQEGIILPENIDHALRRLLREVERYRDFGHFFPLERPARTPV